MLNDDPALTVETPHVAELRRQMVLLAESAPLSPEHTAASELLHEALDARRAEVDERSGRTWTEFAFRSFDAFKRKYVRHRTTRFKNGRMQDAAVADVFLEEACTLQYDRLVYAPPGSGITLGPDDLDGWRGFTVAPKAGDWSKNKAHIRDVICAGNDVLFEWTLDWCAALFQRPGQHAETSLVLRGGQGTGKGHFADV